jgi:hypothetical protein
MREMTDRVAPAVATAAAVKISAGNRKKGEEPYSTRASLK